MCANHLNRCKTSPGFLMVFHHKLQGGPWTHRWHGPTKTHLCRRENVPAFFRTWDVANPRTTKPTLISASIIFVGLHARFPQSTLFYSIWIPSFRQTWTFRTFWTLFGTTSWGILIYTLFPGWFCFPGIQFPTDRHNDPCFVKCVFHRGYDMVPWTQLREPKMGEC